MIFKLFKFEFNSKNIAKRFHGRQITVFTENLTFSIDSRSFSRRFCIFRVKIRTIFDHFHGKNLHFSRNSGLQTSSGRSHIAVFTKNFNYNLPYFCVFTQKRSFRASNGFKVQRFLKNF